MGYFLRNRLVEIHEHLGPQLREFGLKTKASVTHDSIILGFQPKRKFGRYSPVSIVFDDKVVTGLEEASWQHAHLSVEVWGRRTLGDTGWESWKSFDTVRHEIRGQGKEMFDWLSFVIDYNGVVPTIGHPMCIANPNVGDAYKVISRWIPDVQVTQEFDHWHTPIECLHFHDGKGRAIELKIRVVDTLGVLSIDGEPVTNFLQDDMERLSQIALEFRENFAGRRRLNF